MNGNKLNYNPVIAAFVGLSFSGKSTLGQEIVKISNFKLLDVDEARKEISSQQGWLGADAEKEIMMRAYERNHEKAREEIKKGNPVILVATYSRDIYHKMLKNIAHQMGVPLKVFYMHAADETLHDRLDKRLREGSASNVTTMEAILEQKNRYKLIDNVSLTPIDTSLPKENNLEQILNSLEDFKK